jgi:hypothetical protein
MNRKIAALAIVATMFVAAGAYAVGEKWGADYEPDAKVGGGGAPQKVLRDQAVSSARTTSSWFTSIRVPMKLRAPARAAKKSHLIPPSASLCSREARFGTSGIPWFRKPTFMPPIA